MCAEVNHPQNVFILHPLSAAYLALKRFPCLAIKYWPDQL